MSNSNGKSRSSSKHSQKTPPPSAAAAAASLRLPLRQSPWKTMKLQPGELLSSLRLDDIVLPEEEQQEEAAAAAPIDSFEWPPAVQLVPYYTCSEEDAAEDGDETATAATTTTSSQGRRKILRLVSYPTTCRTVCSSLPSLSFRWKPLRRRRSNNNSSDDDKSKQQFAATQQPQPQQPRGGGVPRNDPQRTTTVTSDNSATTTMKQPPPPAAAATNKEHSRTRSSMVDRLCVSAAVVMGAPPPPRPKPFFANSRTEGNFATASWKKEKKQSPAAADSSVEISNTAAVAESSANAAASCWRQEEAAKSKNTTTTQPPSTTYIRSNFSVGGSVQKMAAAGQNTASSNNTALQPAPPGKPLFDIAPTEPVWSCDLCRLHKMTSREFWQHCLGATHLALVQQQKEEAEQQQETPQHQINRRDIAQLVQAEEAEPPPDHDDGGGDDDDDGAGKKKNNVDDVDGDDDDDEWSAVVGSIHDPDEAAASEMEQDGGNAFAAEKEEILPGFSKQLFDADPPQEGGNAPATSTLQKPDNGVVQQAFDTTCANGGVDAAANDEELDNRTSQEPFAEDVTVEPKSHEAAAAKNEEASSETFDEMHSEFPMVGESEPVKTSEQGMDSSNKVVDTCSTAVSQGGAAQLSKQPDEVAEVDLCDTEDVQAADGGVVDSVRLAIATVETKSDASDADNVEETLGSFTDLTGEEAEKENNNDSSVSDCVALEPEHPANDETTDEAGKKTENISAPVPKEGSVCCEEEDADEKPMGESEEPATNSVVETEENMSAIKPTEDHDSTAIVAVEEEEVSSHDHQDQNQNDAQTPEKTVLGHHGAHDWNKSVGKDTSVSPDTLETKPTHDDGSFVISPNSHDSESECGHDETSSRRLMGDLKDEINADLSRMQSLEGQLMADMSEAASQMTSLREDDDFDYFPSPTIELENQCIVTETPPEKIQLDADAVEPISLAQDDTGPPLLPHKEDTPVAVAAAPVAVAAPSTKPSGKVPKRIQELQQLCASVTKNKDDEFWTCSICDIHRLPTHNVKSHCLGKKHKGTVAQQSKDGSDAAENSHTKQSSAPDPEQEKLDFHKNTILENAKTDERFTTLELKDGGWSCGLCGTHNMQMNDLVPHCRGKKHTAAFETTQQISKEEFAVLNDGSWGCTLCDVHGLRASDVQRHFAGKKHKAAVKQDKQ